MEYDELDDLYRDIILDHCRNPRNAQPLDDPDVAGRAVNPFCGDEVDLQIDLNSDHVAHVGVQGRGCSINQATASMLSEAIDGKSVDEIVATAELFKSMMDGSTLSPEPLARLKDLHALSGVRQFPVRIKCALLAWSALEDAIEEYRRAPQA